MQRFPPSSEKNLITVRPPPQLTRQGDANNTEASKKQYRYLRFMCQETIDHVTFVNSRVKDIDGFWLSTLVSTSELIMR